VIFFSFFHCCEKFEFFLDVNVGFVTPWLVGEDAIYITLGTKSSKGTMVVVQQHVGSTKLTIDEQHVVSLDPLPTHPQMCIGGDDQA
jgi:hypothetical protein